LALAKAFFDPNSYNPFNKDNIIAKIGAFFVALADCARQIGVMVTSGVSSFMKDGLAPLVEFVQQKFVPFADCYKDTNSHIKQGFILKGEAGLVSALGGGNVNFDDLSDTQVATAKSLGIEVVKGTGCDVNYMRQDCPNYFLSDSGSWVPVKGTAFTALLNLGPLCAVMSTLEFLGPTCNIGRYVGAVAIFYDNPGDIFNFFLHGGDVGLKKPVIGMQSISGGECDPKTGPCYADNEGYWYAEFPGTIEFNKIYLPEETQANKRVRMVIGKG
jgi:hypothetical protein